MIIIFDRQGEERQRQSRQSLSLLLPNGLLTGWNRRILETATFRRRLIFVARRTLVSFPLSTNYQLATAKHTEIIETAAFGREQRGAASVGTTSLGYVIRQLHTYSLRRKRGFGCANAMRCDIKRCIRHTNRMQMTRKQLLKRSLYLFIKCFFSLSPSRAPK